MSNRMIKVDQLARVEGEGGLHVKIEGNEVIDVRLRIFEPPRFFEAFLRGRDYKEVPDITARICGICPVAYQMSSTQAIEDAFGVTMPAGIRALRRLLYLGEWIESHVLHVAMLHGPDFLGCEDVLQMARKHPQVVQDALAMKKIGNDVMNIIGGREIHPINVRVGGFYRIPAKAELTPLLDRLAWGRDQSIALGRLAAGFEFPDFEGDYEFVALRHPSEYAIIDGRIVSSSGLDIAVREYEFHFEERHQQHSNALHSFERSRGMYCVGPLARYAINNDRLSANAASLAKELHLVPPVRNPFKSILIRCVETVQAFDDAIGIITNYTEPQSVAVEPPGIAVIGFGASEAPRGLLYHRYKLADDGSVTDAKIVPPTAQNLPTMEEDVRQFAGQNLTLSREDLMWKCEQAVRNYDPCISCATHFTTLEIA